MSNLSSLLLQNVTNPKSDFLADCDFIVAFIFATVIFNAVLFSAFTLIFYLYNLNDRDP